MHVLNTSANNNDPPVLASGVFEFFLARKSRSYDFMSSFEVVPLSVSHRRCGHFFRREMLMAKSRLTKTTVIAITYA